MLLNINDLKVFFLKIILKNAPINLEGHFLCY